MYKKRINDRKELRDKIIEAIVIITPDMITNATSLLRRAQLYIECHRLLQTASVKYHY